MAALLGPMPSRALPSPPVRLITVVAEGDPAEFLITAAGNAGLLLLGTLWQSPFAGLALGSVNPVLLIRHSPLIGPVQSA